MVPVRVHNPQSLGTRKATARSKNPIGQLITLGVLNPQKGVSKVKKKTTKKKNHKPARKSNPFLGKTKPAGALKAKRGFKPKRRTNPEGFSIRKPLDFLKAGLFALIGLVVTRQLPQLLLKEKNTGYVGYAANGIAAGAAAWGTHKFISKPAGVAVGIGGGLYVVNRILQERLSPIGSFLTLAGVGDAAAAPSVGRLKSAYFAFPTMRDAKTGAVILPPEIDAAAVQRSIDARAAAGAGAGGSMSGSKLRGGLLAA